MCDVASFFPCRPPHDADRRDRQPFVKVVKNKAYFKRYQTKYRRRRDGKTDYRARKRLIAQDKNKYNSPKFRFVVRFTNKFVTCQIIRAEIIGDKVISSASSAELPRYGLKVGLKNYAAAYCTGLLCARRTLQKMGLDETYEGVDEVDGEMFIAEPVDGENRPFTANLDVGIKSTTTGARVFAALKGAVDGGLNVPHSEKRFVGYDREAKSYSADDMKERIFGEHVAEYMRYLMEEDADKYKTEFANFIKEEVAADDLEDLYTSVHEAIREDPSPSEKEEFEPNKEYKNKAKKSYEDRKASVEEKKAAMAADDEEDEDEDEEDEE